MAKHELGNLFAGIPAELPEELVETLLNTGASSFRIERIVSLGHVSPAGFWYDQPTDEWVLLLSGSARLQFEGEEPVELVPGAYLKIPAHWRHRVEWTDPAYPTIWLAIHHGTGAQAEADTGARSVPGS